MQSSESVISLAGTIVGGVCEGSTGGLGVKECRAEWV